MQVRAGPQRPDPHRPGRGLAVPGQPGARHLARHRPGGASSARWWAAPRPDDAATNFDPPLSRRCRSTRCPARSRWRPSSRPRARCASTAAPRPCSRSPTRACSGTGRCCSTPMRPALPAAAAVVTDTLRRRVRNFGELRTNYSPTLTASQPLRTFEAAADYTEPGWARYQAVARYYGISERDRVVVGRRHRGHPRPVGKRAAAVRRGRREHAHHVGVGQPGPGRSASGSSSTFDSPANPGTIQVAFTDSPALGPPVTQVAVTHRGGPAHRPGAGHRPPAGAAGARRAGPAGCGSRSPASPRCRTRRSAPRWASRRSRCPGCQASRAIVAPRCRAAGPGRRGAGQGPAAAVRRACSPRCAGCAPRRWPRPPRSSTASTRDSPSRRRARPALRGSAVLTAPSLVTRYARLAHGQPRVTRVVAVHRRPAGPAEVAPLTATRRPPGSQARPTRTRRSPSTGGIRRTIRPVTIERPPGASGPLQVLLSGPAGQARGGTVRRPGRRCVSRRCATSKLTFMFTPVQAPLQITDVVIPGVPPLHTPAEAVPAALRSGAGASRLNGKVLPTRVTGTFADLLTGRPMPFTACSPVTIAAGANRVAEPASDAFDVQDVVLRTPAARARPASRRARSPRRRCVSWTSSRAGPAVAAATRSYLVVNENFNAGLAGGLRRPAAAAGAARRVEAGLAAARRHAGVVTLTYQPERPTATRCRRAWPAGPGHAGRGGAGLASGAAAENPRPAGSCGPPGRGGPAGGERAAAAAARPPALPRPAALPRPPALPAAGPWRSPRP